MKVSDLIEDLKAFVHDMEIKIAIENGREFTIGAIYAQRKILWIDVDPDDVK